MSEISSAKDCRIDLRVTQEQKELLELAASLKGISLSAYTLFHVLPVAKQDIDANERLVLSNRDRDLFMSVMENPPELKGKLDGFSVRVPTINVSLVDLKFIAKRPTTVLFDDYLRRRYYHGVEKLARKEEVIGRMARFTVTPGPIPPDMMTAAIGWFTDHR